VIFQLNGSEMADWMECWCFRCQHDHGMTHTEDTEELGCPHAESIWSGRDDPVFSPHGETWWRTIPAGVVCSEFTPCTQCPPDDPNAERRNGETRAEFHDRLRAEIIALPRVEEQADG
jgi:hypothetical protein